MTRWIVLAVTGGFLAVFVSNPAAVKTKKAINEQQLFIHAIPAPKDGEAKKTTMESAFYRVNRTMASSTRPRSWAGKGKKHIQKETGVLWKI